MHEAQPDPRTAFAALAAREIDWHTDETRMLPEVGGARRAAVLVLFGVLDDVLAAGGVPAQHPVAADLDVLLLRRASTLRDHAGQIAFPGGGIDPDDAGAGAAALREAAEETGVEPASVELLGTLPEIPLAVSNFMVTPVLGWWKTANEVAAVDHDETVEVFRMPVADLLDPANRVSTEFARGLNAVRMPAFTVSGRLVWGFTAIVLSRLFDELGWTRPWDQSRTVDPFVD